jgi:superfamily II DNA or RNA helicase
MAKNINISIDNLRFHFHDAPRKIVRILAKRLSYLVQGHTFSPAFRRGHWDGREHLLRYSRKRGYSAPVGLLSDALEVFEEHGIEIHIDDQRPEPKCIEFDWSESIELRDYQLEAVKAITAPGLYCGRGILKLPIRSGKSIVAAAVIRKLGVRTLFIVPSAMLLHQTRASLKESLQRSIGAIGDGLFEEEDVTVATVQTLAKKPVKRCYELAVFDECFPAGTLVDGRPIESIRVGDLVSSYDETTGALCKRKVSHVFESKPSGLMHVHTVRGSIVCTSGHPFLTSRGWRAAIQLTPSSLVLCVMPKPTDQAQETLGPDEILHPNALETSSTWGRVTRTEILEPGEDGEFGGLCRGGHVYNLEVEDTHTYVAGRFVVHNCHHLRGEAWRDVMLKLNTRYKVGLSATAYFDNESEVERGVIWLKACCGDIAIDISTSQLINEGFLMRPVVQLHCVREPDNLKAWRWSTELRNAAIYENETRNRKIVELTASNVAAGLRVLVVSNRIGHTHKLIEMIGDNGIEALPITGREPTEIRRKRLDDFAAGHCRVLVGTVFGEGLDIPELECVINAEGGKDAKATVQRMRNLTPHHGKIEAIFIDFIDLTNRYFAEHTQERLAVYRSEEAFEVKIVE